MGNFIEAARVKSKLRMSLAGVSGSGKTVGALLIAYGITGDWKKVALIDSEHNRALMYANREELGIGKFLHCPIEAPYTADKYKSLVREGADVVGPDGVVIIDSFSHVWSNEGGVLDYKDKVAAQQGKNSYTAWNEAGKMQNSLVNTVLSVNAHTIVTMRAKMEYSLQENERGRKEPVKVGLAPIQRDDTEYEFDIALNIDRSHIATASKDVTFLDEFGQMITIELGEQLKLWLNEGMDMEEYCGQRPLKTDQLNQIFRASKQDPELCKQVYKMFGYNEAKSILYKDYHSIIDKVKDLVHEKEGAKIDE